MKKNDLTDKQKETIAFLESQFTALNESNKGVPFNLIDVNKITAEADRIAIGVKNLKIHNDAITALRDQLVEKIVKQINEDFERGKLPLEAKQSVCHDITICGYTKKYSSDRDIKLEVRRKERNTEFGSEYTGEFYYAESCIAKETFPTVEAYLASEKVQKSLLRLYQSVEKDTECQRR